MAFSNETYPERRRSTASTGSNDYLAIQEGDRYIFRHRVFRGAASPIYLIAGDASRRRVNERKEGSPVNRKTARVLLTILMYGGVAVFLLPYIIERARLASTLMLLGAITAVVCGMLRCYFTESNE